MIIIIPYSSPISSWINFQLSKLMRPDGPWLRAIILIVVLITISIIIRLINRRTKRRLEILLFPRVTLHADHGKHVATKRDRLKIRARHRGRGWGGKSKKIIIFKPTYPIPFHAPLTAWTCRRGTEGGWRFSRFRFSSRWRYVFFFSLYVHSIGTYAFYSSVNTRVNTMLYFVVFARNRYIV